MERPEFLKKLQEVVSTALSSEKAEKTEVKNTELEATEEAEETKEELAAEAALEDGTIVMTDTSWEAGANISAKVGEGEFQPLAVGEYTFADGAKVVVEEDGIIAAFMPAEEAPAEEEAEEMNAEQSNDDLIGAFKEALQPIAERLLSVEQSVQSKDEEIESLKAELSKAKEAGESVQKLAKQKKVENADLSRMSVRERIAHNLKNLN